MIKASMFGVAAITAVVMVGTANAQSLNKADSGGKDSPGTTGAMGNVNHNGVATDPGGVAAQQGANKGSPGTVGAAPGETPPPQKK